MNQTALILTVLDALVAEDVPYILAGSIASSAYGIPRSTKDVDFVVETTRPAFDNLLKRLEEWYTVDPQQHLETLTWTRRYILKAHSWPFQVELFIKDEDSHHIEQWDRRQFLYNPIIEREVWMPTPEDTIVQKVRWGRPQDRIDAQNVIAVQAELLDWPYIEKWCDTHGTRKTLEDLRAEIPPI